MSTRSYLLDTQVILWMDEDRSRLPQQVWSALQAGPLRFYSAASAWEVAIKRAAGKLRISEPLSRAAERFRLRGMPVSVAHGEAAGALPRHHGDPCDRLLVAQARIENLVLVTSDVFLQRYDVDLLLIS